VWSSTGIDKRWSVAVAKWKDSRKKLVLSLREKEWKERGTLFTNISNRGACMNYVNVL
jgi:hypothetical protein